MSRCLLTGLCVLLIPFAALADDNWPAWRGPNANGVSDATGLPTEWNLQGNIAWKADLPSWSGGTPVIWGDRIFVTSPSKDEASGDGGENNNRGDEPVVQDDQQQQDRQGQGRGQRGQRRGQGRGQGRGRGRRGGGGRGGGPQGSAGGDTLMLLCLSKADGSVLWQRDLDTGNEMHRKQNNSSPSPVTDGQHVWTVTGNGAVACFTMDGEPVWDDHLGEKFGEFGLNWGYASSPLLFDGKLIIEVLHGMRTEDPSYVVAFDGATGEVAWRVERWTDALRESPDAYTTPAVVEHGDGHAIVISGGDYVTGHDPDTGEELWRSAGLNPRKAQNFRIVGSPVVADGLIYAPTRNSPLLALKPGGSGDVTESHLAFKYEDRGGADVPSPLCDGKYLYIVSDRGLISCLDAKTGKVVYGTQRLENAGTISSSPILADGKIYVVDEQAKTFVIAAGPDFEVLATNELDGEYTLASIAVSGNQLFVRTAKSLFCIGQVAE